MLILECSQGCYGRTDGSVTTGISLCNFVGVVFCDISKAFDRVWHKGLLRKLESIGIRGSLLSWVKNYLYERKHRVVINNSTSSWRDINAGVPGDRF